MQSETFVPSLGCALRENLIVAVATVVLVPLALLARAWSHPGMTRNYALIVGGISAVFFFLFYTARFFVRNPKRVTVSDVGLLFSWRNGGETEVRWDDIRKGVLLKRWGWRWRFSLSGPRIVLWGDGFPGAICNRLSDIIVDQLNARNIPIEIYNEYSQRRFTSEPPAGSKLA